MLFFLSDLFYINYFLPADCLQRTTTKTKDEPAHKEPESLNEYSEYNALIHDAESKNDFNLSIRYLYLQSLKKLSDNELIVFSPDKTNNLYVQELSGRTTSRNLPF